MLTHLIRSVLLMIVTLLGVTMLIFVLVRLLPGDAIFVRMSEAPGMTEERMAAMRAELGLDQPAAVQYARWLGGAVRGDFGESFVSGRSVLELTLRRIPVSIELAVLAILFAPLIGVPIGIISALRQNSFADLGGRLTAVAIISVPNFVIATLWILATSIWFRWQPPLGYRPFWEDPGVHLQQILPPAIALGAHSAGVLMRIARSSMLEVLRTDFVRTASAKGLRERVVTVRHALPNAVIPIISVASTQFAQLLGGSVIMETIFTIPGVGSQTVDALFTRDYPQLLFNVLFFGTAVLLINFLTDFVYSAVDPRIRVGR